MKRNILVLLTCSLGMTAWGETHVLDGAQSSSSVVYVARYSYDHKSFYKWDDRFKMYVGEGTEKAYFFK